MLKPYRDAIENKHQWTIVAVPSKKWAKKVFPGERTSTAVEKLWEVILKTVRVTEDNDPQAEWDKHNRTIIEKCEKLTAYDFDYLHYESRMAQTSSAGSSLAASGTAAGKPLSTAPSSTPICPLRRLSLLL